MKVIYKCEVCGREFNSPLDCGHHEESHFSGSSKIKCELYLQGEDLCDYCEHSYYVYGCEQDCNYDKCSYKNNYKDFQPVEPLHNKRAHGGV